MQGLTEGKELLLLLLELGPRHPVRQSVTSVFCPVVPGIEVRIPVAGQTDSTPSCHRQKVLGYLPAPHEVADVRDQEF